MRKQSQGKGEVSAGKLRIGDHWNAITIIALSQSNPLKAVAEFVENSIDAHARNITITRGKERGQHYLRIADDGDGVPRDETGAPDFKFVATHICDSIKRRMKEGGRVARPESSMGVVHRTKAQRYSRELAHRHHAEEGVPVVLVRVKCERGPTG